ncbi:MAG: 4'-phosphopantetheinyl transferase superfamily protein [Terracoccus sp.]
MTVGIDLTSTVDWERRLAHMPVVSDVAFSLPERWWCDGSTARHALVWAVKEAVVKLLGTGFGSVGWQDVTVRPGVARPGSLADALRVNISPTALEACRNTPLPQPLRCQVRHDGDLILAVVAAGPGRVAVEEQMVARASPLQLGGDPDRSSRAAVGEACRAAAREAGRRAVARLTGGPAQWSTPQGGRPTVRWPCGATSAASFAHHDDLAYAAVHDTRLTDLPIRASFPLIFNYDEGLLAGMRSSRRWVDIGTTEAAWFGQPQLTTALRPSA